MPVYEYQCQKCGAKEELLQKMGATAEGLTCSACGATEMKKIISAHLVGKSGSRNQALPDCGASCNTLGGCCSGGSCGRH